MTIAHITSVLNRVVLDAISKVPWEMHDEYEHAHRHIKHSCVCTKISQKGKGERYVVKFQSAGLLPAGLLGAYTDYVALLAKTIAQRGLPWVSGTSPNVNFVYFGFEVYASIPRGSEVGVEERVAHDLKELVAQNEPVIVLCA